MSPSGDELGTVDEYGSTIRPGKAGRLEEDGTGRSRARGGTMEFTNASDDHTSRKQHASGDRTGPWQDSSETGIEGWTAFAKHTSQTREERDDGDGEPSSMRGPAATGEPQAARAHTYRAYLVRLWQDGAEAPWRALTRDAETGEERRFATIEQLFVFLHRQTQSCNELRLDAGRDTREHRRNRADRTGGESAQ
jgi:hypothetical protein